MISDGGVKYRQKYFPQASSPVIAAWYEQDPVNPQLSTTFPA